MYIFFIAKFYCHERDKSYFNIVLDFIQSDNFLSINFVCFGNKFYNLKHGPNIRETNIATQTLSEKGNKKEKIFVSNFLDCFLKITIADV